MSDDFLKGFKVGFEAALKATAQKAVLREEERSRFILAEKQKAKQWAVSKGFLKAATTNLPTVDKELVLSGKLKAKQWASDQGFFIKKK